MARITGILPFDHNADIIGQLPEGAIFDGFSGSLVHSRHSFFGSQLYWGLWVWPADMTRRLLLLDPRCLTLIRCPLCLKLSSVGKVMMSETNNQCGHTDLLFIMVRYNFNRII